MVMHMMYRDLSPSFRVVYPIAKGLLAMAWEKELISSSQAKLAITQIQTASRNDALPDDVRATFVVDLGAALGNTRESQVEALAERFDAIAIFDDLTIATDYIQSPLDRPGHES